MTRDPDRAYLEVGDVRHEGWLSVSVQRSIEQAAAQFSAFQISRALATFFETCDVFLCPTLCSPPLMPSVEARSSLSRGWVGFT